MRPLHRMIVLGLAAALPAQAQIIVEGRLDYAAALQYESIPVRLTIVNNSGEPLTFGGTAANAELGFDVEQVPGAFIKPTGVPLLPEPLLIEAQGTVNRTINLEPAYDLRPTGPYTIRARVEWGDKVFLSPKMFLDVLPGLAIGKLTAGIPGRPGEMRTYTLRTMSRRRIEHLFLRIDDDDQGKCYGVVNLGPVVRRYEPKLQVDGNGNIHVLFQSGPERFTHSVISPDGQPVDSSQFLGNEATIGMSREGGRVSVEGAPAPRDAGADDEE